MKFWLDLVKYNAKYRPTVFVFVYMYLAWYTPYLCILSIYYNFNHTLYLQVYLYTGTYIRCMYTLDLRFSMYLTTLVSTYDSSQFPTLAIQMGNCDVWTVIFHRMISADVCNTDQLLALFKSGVSMYEQMV